jgi:hypothetical protein
MAKPKVKTDTKLMRVPIELAQIINERATLAGIGVPDYLRYVYKKLQRDGRD